MIAATLKVLTWGTVATAVASAALLAASDGGMLRAERAADPCHRTNMQRRLGYRTERRSII